MRAGMAAAPPSTGALQYQHHPQHHHHHQQHYRQYQQAQQQPTQQIHRSAPGASPVSQVSVAELAKIFGARQRSASLQRQPQYQQHQQYPTMDKRTNPASAQQLHQQQWQQYKALHQQRDAGSAQSPGRRGGQPTPVYADPRAAGSQHQQGRSGSGGSSSGRWRSQESLSEASPQLLMASGNSGASGGGGGGLMFRSVQVDPPPRLLPSGVPPVSQPGSACAMPQSQSANLGSLVLRPSAFRPVRIGNGNGAFQNPQQQLQHPVTPPSGDSGFIDVSGGRRSQDPQMPPPRQAAVADCNYDVDQDDNDHEDDRSSACAATSPSDSGLLLADYENLLREKDNELAELRRTMEQNESALVRVFEERQGELESRLRNEMSLNARLTPAVSLGNRRLRQSEQAISDLRLQSQQHLDELQSLKSRLRATEAELRDRSGRVQQLEASLAASRESLDAATWELRRLRRLQVNDGDEGDDADGGAAPSVDRSCQTAASAASEENEVGDDPLEQRQLLLAELAELRTRLNDQKSEFDRERSQWLEEKSQVLNYQKQLQMNYLQLTKRSQRLEAESQQLSVDLETKEMHILRLSNGCSSGASSAAGTLQSQAGSQC